MYQALPYKTWHTSTTFPTSTPLNNLTSPSTLSNRMAVVKGRESMEGLVDENAVIIFGRRGCCMIHVLRRLLLGLGVNPAVYEIDDHDEQSVVDELKKVGPTTDGGGSDGCTMNFPTVFIGGRWFGDLDRVMATHITGELTPLLKDAGALWL